MVTATELKRTLVKVVEREVDFQRALLEISGAAGAFNRDPFEHCKNTVRDMHAIAVAVLKKYSIEPARENID